MIRRITFLLSLATIGVGIWVILRVGPTNAACDTTLSFNAGNGASVNCMNVVSSYFMGYALTIGGLLILALALWGMSKHERQNLSPKHEMDVPRTFQRGVETIKH